MDVEKADSGQQTPLEITTQVNEGRGVMKARTLENGENTTIYRNRAMVGENLISPWDKKHVFLWILDKNTAVMLATDDPEEIQPLINLKIESIKIPELLSIADVTSSNPYAIPLIYIGRIDGDENILQIIQEKTQVQNFLHIPPGNSDDWRFQSWRVGFEGIQTEISIYPGSGDIYLSCLFVNGIPEVTEESLYKKYSEYFRKGGVIGLSFMRDASTLSREEMRQKYPRDSFYIGDPQEQIDSIQKSFGINLTPKQKTLYYNLRWIPSDTFQVVYDVGFKPPQGNQSENKTVYRHPKDLDIIGLLSQVLNFTEDAENEAILREHCEKKQLFNYQITPVIYY